MKGVPRIEWIRDLHVNAASLSLAQGSPQRMFRFECSCPSLHSNTSEINSRLWAATVPSHKPLMLSVSNLLTGKVTNCSLTDCYVNVN
jgi:hypothetical protein